MRYLPSWILPHHQQEMLALQGWLCDLHRWNFLLELH